MDFPSPKGQPSTTDGLRMVHFVDIQVPYLALKGQQMQPGSDVKYRISLSLLSNHTTNRRFK